MTDVPVPSYRVRPSDDGGPPWRLIAIGGGLAAALLVGGAIAWGIGRIGAAPRSVPLIEPDPRPFKVRPDDPGGLRVPNQDELIFERNRGPANNGAARLAPEPEAPRIDALRAQVAQPPPQPVAPAAPNAQAPTGGAAPAARTAPGATPPAATAQPAAPAPTAAARPAPAPGGAIRVQLGALTSEEAARGEWDRLARRHADLLGAFRPQVVRFEREGQATLFRLRTGGFADVAAANGFCEQARARSIPCTIIR
ncbi:SPOR domain-containing protein [Roseomonas fluvialis]|uniref:SPOR domain-containing protein n=1 Tax=Roseomonas fluvialis TaxID=1750527 RepID=A0ABM7Y4F0_9PROT|nr:SPOR domain-containing protein [Roseomonas fluvialis]BDG72723.1 hypothetical protein Rmf_26520 [Roseomonas fluvialis]